MALDARFICSSDLEGYFVDKLTGEPLAAGTLYFYEQGTNTPKEVYQLTGSPPDTFVSLGSSVTLNSTGCYSSDGSDNIVIYYFPYDGTPDDSSGDQVLYQVEVFNSDNVSQFTRYQWPPLASNLVPQNNSGDDTKNYIPNGQFLYHNDHQVTGTDGLGNDKTYIAQGGWSFKKTTGGTGSYTITFNSEIDGIDELNNFPPFSVNVVCNSAGAETKHDLCIEWPDVNVFSKMLNGSDTNQFNFMFGAKLNSGVSQDYELIMTRYYGVGGTTTDVTSIATISVTSTYQYFRTVISMPDNSAKNVGEGSFIELALRTPNGTASSARFTNFCLSLGATGLTVYPIKTNSDSLIEGIPGFMPTPAADGSDLYLPLILTPQGMKFDYSVIGQIIGKTQKSTEPVAQGYNELLMDGQVYLASDYSTIGIPYQRLMDYLIRNCPTGTVGSNVINANCAPMYGTGPLFVLICLNADPAKFNLNFNTASGSNVAGDGTSGFTHTSADPLYVYTVTGVPTAGTYFTFTTSDLLVYNVWYKVNGSGTAPATPTGANIQVDILSTDTIAAVILATQRAVNYRQFMVLDAQGYFWRGLDPSGTVDLGPTRIVAGLANLSGAFLGSVEDGAYIAHTHLATPTGTVGTVDHSEGGAPSAVQGSGPVGPTHQLSLTLSTTVDAAGGSPAGGLETRPVNLALNWYIRY